MGCQNTSVCKICRRENMKLFLKGDRCYTDKCSFDRRNYPPGQHGQKRMKFSEFALQLREKQKAKRYYGLSEKQFRKFVVSAEQSKDITGEALLKALEKRLDNVVYTLSFTNSRKEARQLVSHGHILVNGKEVNIPSFILKKGDTVEVKQSSREIARVMSAVQNSGRKTLPSWLEVDHATFKGTVKESPTRDEVTLSVEESMIVEFYSR